jgi:hypothetical protein
VPFALDEPTKVSWDLAGTADANGSCTVTALRSPYDSLARRAVPEKIASGVRMAKQPQRLAKTKTDLMPQHASCNRWDTLTRRPFASDTPRAPGVMWQGRVGVF